MESVIKLMINSLWVLYFGCHRKFQLPLKRERVLKGRLASKALCEYWMKVHHFGQLQYLSLAPQNWIVYRSSGTIRLKRRLQLPIFILLLYNLPDTFILTFCSKRSHSTNLFETQDLRKQHDQQLLQLEALKKIADALNITRNSGSSPT